MFNQEVIENYHRDGFAVLRNAIPSELIDSYLDSFDSTEIQPREFGKFEVDDGDLPGTYLDTKEIIDILCGKTISSFLEEAGRAVALHKSATYITTSEKGWHQDCALPNRESGDNYTGAWVALEDITEEAGPMEMVIGSHNWDLDLYQIYNAVRDGKPYRDGFNSNDFFSEEIKKRNSEIFKFTAQKGDVMVWHGYLVHRGSMATNLSSTRKSLVGHYCNTNANPDTDENSAACTFESLLEFDDIFAKSDAGGFYFKTPL